MELLLEGHIKKLALRLSLIRCQEHTDRHTRYLLSGTKHQPVCLSLRQLELFHHK